MIWALVALAGAVAVAPFAREAMRRPVEAFRDRAPGAFAKLSQGVTHYRWSGPEGGPVIVLVHGLTTPSFVWREVEPKLIDAGFRLLSYDLYGRGFSDRPGGAQDAGFFLRQLEDLLQDQQVEDGFGLVGYSMGGAIGTAFAAAHPGRTRWMTLIAPAGIEHALGAAGRATGLPDVVGKWMMLALFPGKFRAGVEAERGAPGVPEEVTQGQLDQIERRGYIPAVRASLRGILAETREAEHREVARQGLPVGAIWGDEDATIPIAAKAVMQGWNPGARHEVVAGAGHTLAITHADQVARFIVEQSTMPGLTKV
jgi:pimeloyl-ACP methyl ester carboxylesterase